MELEEIKFQDGINDIDANPDFGKNVVDIATKNGFGFADVMQDYNQFKAVELGISSDPSAPPFPNYREYDQELLAESFADTIIKSNPVYPEIHKAFTDYQDKSNKAVQDYFNVKESKLPEALPEGMMGISRHFRPVELASMLSTGDLIFAKGIIQGDILNYPQSVVDGVNKELRIREIVDKYKNLSDAERSSFAITAAIDPFGIRRAMAKVGINKQVPEITEAIARAQAEENGVDPLNVPRIAQFGGGILNAAIEFWAVGKISPAKAVQLLNKMPAAVRPLVKTGTKFAAREALQYPREGETLEDRTGSVGESFVFGAAMGYAGQAMPNSAVRVPLLATGLSGYTYLRTGDSEAAIETAASVIGFEALHLMNKGLRLGQGRARNLYADKAVKEARKHNPELYKLSNRQVKNVIEQQQRNLEEAKVSRDISHDKARDEVKSALAAKRQGDDSQWQALMNKYVHNKPTEKKSVGAKPKAETAKGETIAKLGQAQAVKTEMPVNLEEIKETPERKLSLTRSELAVDIENVKSRIRMATGQSKVTEPKVVESDALKAVMKKASVISKEVYRHAYKEGKDEAVEKGKADILKLKDKHTEKTQRIRTAVELIQAFVPDEEQYKFTLRAIGVKTDKGLDKLADQIDEYLQKQDQRAAIKGLKETWNQIRSDYRFGKTQLGKLEEIPRQRILSIMDRVDLVKLSADKEADIKSLAEYVNKLGGELSGEITSLNADVEALLKIPESRLNELKRLEKVSAADMVADDIRGIQQHLKYITRQHELKNKIITRMGAEDLRDKRDASISEIRPSPKALKLQDDIDTVSPRKMSIGKAVKDVFYLSSAHSDTLVERITSANPDNETFKLLVTDLWEGENKEIGVFIQAREIAQNVQKQYNLTDKEWTVLGDDIQVSIGGKTVKITMEDALGLYMNSLNSNNMRRLYQSENIAFGNTTIPLPTTDEINQIIAMIPDNLKSWRNVFKEVNLQVQQPSINETHKLLNGYEPAKDENYYPTSRKFHRKVRGTKSETSVSIEDEGRYQPITGGRETFKIIPFREAFLNGLQLDAKLAGMAIPMRNARTLLSDKKWQDAVIKAGYEDEMNTLVDLVESYQKTKTDKDIVNLYGQKFLNYWAQSTLSLRLSTIGAQVGSLPAATEGIDVKYLSSPVPITTDRIDWMKEQPFFWQRWHLGRYNIELGAAAAESTGLYLLFDKTPLVDYGTKGLLYGDIQAIGNIHIWAENEVRNTTGLQEGTPEYREAVNKRAEFLTRRNQPAWSFLNRSKLGSSRNVLARSILMFRSAREAQYNVALRAANEYGKSEKTKEDKLKYAKSAGSILASAITVALWKNTIRWAIQNGIIPVLNYFGIWRSTKDLEEVVSDTSVDTIRNVASLAPGGNIIGGVVESGIRAAVEGKRFGRFNTGNPFVDIGEQITSLSIDLGSLLYNGITGAVDKDGEKKYKDDIARTVDGTLGLAAIAARAPYSGPMAEWVYPFIKDSEHSVIRNMRVDDTDDPSDFIKKVEDFYKQKDDLKKKADGLLFPGWKREDIVKKYPSRNLIPKDVANYLVFDSLAQKISTGATRLKDYDDILDRRDFYNQVNVAIDSVMMELD
ncbi:MAG: hypothetical protein PHS33_08640 [Candidatus Omnitrophica bacterium]|nr:hypothetical protein [Candidatus Omnitrophota bacterium]